MENIFEEIIVGNFPNLKDADFKIQEAQGAPNKLNPNRHTPRHIIIKMAKVKERILKAAREKQSINYKGTPIRLSADFSTETLQVRREWQDIFKVLKGLFTIARTWKQSKCPSTDDWIRKMWYIYIMEYYSAIK